MAFETKYGPEDENYIKTIYTGRMIMTYGIGPLAVANQFISTVADMLRRQPYGHDLAEGVAASVVTALFIGGMTVLENRYDSFQQELDN